MPLLGTHRSTLQRLVTSLLAVDPAHDKRYLLDASPHLPEQVELASGFGGPDGPMVARLFDGIYVTHAHLGHYAGLAYLGREAYGAETTTGQHACWISSAPTDPGACSSMRGTSRRAASDGVRDSTPRELAVGG